MTDPGRQKILNFILKLNFSVLKVKVYGKGDTI